MVFANAFSAVVTVFCIAFLGYALKRKGWISNDMAGALPKFITSITLPPFLTRTVLTTFTREEMLEMLSGSLVPFLSIFCCFAMATALARIFKIAEGRKGTFKVAFATSNTMNIGLPINIALYGEASIPFVLLYFFANVTFFWTVGNYCIALDGDGAHVKLFSLDSLKKIFSPPLVGFAAGVLLVLLDMQLPAFIDKTFKYVGEMTIGLSIMYIGVMLQDLKISEFHLERDLVLVLVGRFIVAPLTIVAISMALPVPDMMRKVFIIQSSLPVMMNAVILTGHYRADAKYAAVLISISTFMAIGTVPLFAILLGYFLP